MENTNEVNKKNKVFLILSFFGIVFVVLGHLNNVNIGVNILFPYYSFHMPLFMFIAGYLFKEGYVDCVKDYILKKFRNLMIPYYVCNLFYGLVLVGLKYFHIVKFGSKFDLYNFFLDI